MSTNIRSFGQPSNITVSSYENGGSTTVSSFGAKNILRLKADASMYSKSGGSVQIRGIGNKSFLHAKELRLVQPVELRFKGAPGTNTVLMINQFLDAFTSKSGTSATGQGGRVDLFRDRAVDSGAVSTFNCVRAVDNGLFKSFSSLVMSLNGSSWQVRSSSFIDSFDKLFAECRYDSEGNATPCPPYTNACNSAGAARDQPGVYEACNAFLESAKVIHVSKTATGAYDAQITDIVYHVEFISKLCIGPLAYASHPALQNLLENDIHALPHVHDLSFEWTYKTNPLLYWLKTVCTDQDSGMSVDCQDMSWGGQNDPSANTLRYGTHGVTGLNLGGMDCDGMWKSAVVGEASVGSAAAKAAGKYVNLLRPYVTYMLSEAPEARINYKPLYTIPSIRMTTYQQDTAIAAGESTGKVNFEYIQVDNLSSLVCLSVFEADRNGANNSVGPRQPRWKGTVAQAGCRGAEFHNVSCPLRWSSLKINLSVANSVLGSITGGLETQFSQYATYLKYAKNKVDFNSWKKYNQMILFSPQELVGAGMALESKQISLSVSVEFERTASDTLTTPRDWCRHENSVYYPKVSKDGIERAKHKAVNYQASLWFLNQEVVTLSPGQCGIEMLSFSPAEVQSAFTAASRTLENPVLDQFVS